jgi:hypothetical protein
MANYQTDPRKNIRSIRTQGGNPQTNPPVNATNPPVSTPDPGSPALGSPFPFGGGYANPIGQAPNNVFVQTINKQSFWGWIVVIIAAVLIFTFILRKK